MANQFTIATLQRFSQPNLRWLEKIFLNINCLIVSKKNGKTPFSDRNHTIGRWWIEWGRNDASAWNHWRQYRRPGEPFQWVGRADEDVEVKGRVDKEFHRLYPNLNREMVVRRLYPGDRRMIMKYLHSRDEDRIQIADSTDSDDLIQQNS